MGFYFYWDDEDLVKKFEEAVEEYGDRNEACRKWLAEHTSLDEKQITGFNEIFVGPPMEDKGTIHVDGEIDVTPKPVAEPVVMEEPVPPEPEAIEIEEDLDEVVYVYGSEYHKIDEYRGTNNAAVKTECGVILGRGEAKEQALVDESLTPCVDCYVTGQRRGTGNRAQLHKQELIQELKRLGKELGKKPSTRDMDQYGNHASSTYKRIFGSWNNAIKEAGYTPRTPRGVKKTHTKEEILDFIEEFKETNGKWPTGPDIDETAPFSESLLYYQFDGINDAIKQAKKRRKTV